MNTKVIGKDLTKEAPRSPRIRVGGYAILGRTIDKCRALVAGNIGEYHFDCPLDNMLFGFKGVNPYNDPERREWFVEQVKPLGLDPAKTTLFDWLEKDDKACHAQKAA